ncbi:MULTISPECIES: hypothetical protein [Thermomicrobium]|jgi:hypothetical protein|uniref:Uncharacterized protein n=2 Tax=Thermomicrobium TaxID=499 RepID=B9L0Z6_THERP|nr:MULTISPECIES: hypothetical protein [Thermomicrobium]ACM05740.1 hypothetical protein trd_1707 [Thermomicrobium roseum DSM 5159]MBO9307230.1 hypothetical protein [Thermomicrobium sp.]MBO9359172.1 hypothetical protein [Thermomicrobium sp.]MBO9385509.1 hypothetical protein [Thermomicrobium sp.]MBO9403794.1 hypothetical protein [Thermomicrobium sp.]
MRQRANQLWLIFFLPGTTLVLIPFVLTRVFGLALSETTSSIVGGTGLLLLFLSLFTQLPLPRRRNRERGQK